MIQPSVPNDTTQTMPARTNMIAALTIRPCSSWPRPGMKKLASAAMTLPPEPCPDMAGSSRKVVALPAAQRLVVLDGERVGGGGDAARVGVLAEDAGDEALPLADALDLDGDGVHRLLEVREAVPDLARQLRGEDGAALPDAARVGDGEREDAEDDEHAAEDEELLGEGIGLGWRVGNDGAGHGGRLRDLE